MSDWFNPPTPVTTAEQGVIGEPVKITLAGQVTVTVDEALAIVKFLLSLLPV